MVDSGSLLDKDIPDILNSYAHSGVDGSTSLIYAISYP